MTFRTHAPSPRCSRFLLLAPNTSAPSIRCFRNWLDDRRSRAALMDQMQRLRGRIYLDDGAISPDSLDGEQRHRLPGDEESWHILALDPHGDVQGCVRVRRHSPTARFDDLALRISPLASDPDWAPRLRRAVEAEIERTQRFGGHFFEIGGWALSEKLRGTRAAIYTALGAFALARTLGGGSGVATATVRNHSASILKRIGGRPLDGGGVAIPSCYDPRYRCQMELLCFDSRHPSARFAQQLEAIQERLLSFPVLSAAQPESSSPLFGFSPIGRPELVPA